jgi:hypothetical protein
MCRSSTGLALDRPGLLAAAARLDALGVEVLGALEARGLREVEIELAHRVELDRGGRTVDLPFKDLADLADLADDDAVAGGAAVIRAVRCEGRLRRPA